MDSETKHYCIAEPCDKCGQDHCKCSACPPSPNVTSRDELDEEELSDPSVPHTVVADSWVLKQVQGRYCFRCELYYDDPKLKTCPNCLSSGFMTTRTWYRRIMLENITAAVLWGALTAGIAWIVMLAVKIFFRVNWGIWSRIYDPANSKLNDPVPTKTFMAREFFGVLLGLPLILILACVVVVLCTAFAAVIVGLLKGTL